VTSNDSAAPAVVVATRNRGKLREILVLLQEAKLGFRLLTIDELAPHAELREDEATFEGNALAKARQAAAATGLPALADDSGLEVDALGGAPGVWSARYAGLPSDDARNNEKLAQAMAASGVPAGGRGARYRCVAAFVDPGRGLELTRAGVCEGEILSAPRGSGGFGYDPLFVPVGYDDDGRTMAELSQADKDAISHRGRAARELLAWLQQR